MEKYRILDLFCGAGGFSLGFELTRRFEVAGAIDYWEPALNTYKFNRPQLQSLRVKQEDLTKIFDNNFQQQLFDDFDIKSKPIDVIIGGPPCQGMSLAGKRLENDPRNQLFLSFVKAVELFQPKLFIMENVPGLLTAERGKILEAVINSFHEIGYNHFEEHRPSILSSEAYGVPQMRRRLFFIGINTNLEKEFTNWPPKATHYPSVPEGQGNFLEEASSNVKNYVTVRDAISDLPQIKSGEGSEKTPYPDNKILSDYQKLMRDWDMSPHQLEPMIYNHESPNHSDKLIKMISEAVPGASVDPKYSDSKKWDPDRPGFTVKALGAGGGSTNRRAFHYNIDTPRGSTVRENARIQSFPDWYIFTGPKTHQMTQVGNAVPPLLSKAIAEVVIEYLDEI